MPGGTLPPTTGPSQFPSASPSLPSSTIDPRTGLPTSPGTSDPRTGAPVLPGTTIDPSSGQMVPLPPSGTRR
jgi:hypothetical protein